MEDLPKDPLEFVLRFIPDDPARALEKILPEMCIAEVSKVDRPSAAQLQKLRGLEPYTELGLADLKTRLAAGMIRFGPQHRAILSELIVPQLVGVGLEATVRQATRQELKGAKLLVDEEPEYFRETDSPPPQ
jgi:hypothetical protein